jgi:hypothetical protein
MEEVQIIEYKGKKIVYIDFQDHNFQDINKIKKIIDASKALIVSHPLNSVISLTNCTGLRFSSQLIEVFKEFTEFNKPYVKTGAVIGIMGLQKVAYDAVMKFSKRNIQTFSTKEEALEWLANQE